MTTDADPAFSVELRERLIPFFGADIAIERLALLAGGASKEAWALDLRTAQGTRELLVRRAGGGVIHQETLTLEDEHRLLEVACAVGVRVPKPYGYLGEIAGRPAFVSERVSGETIGRRIVQRPDLADARAVLPAQMAEELAKIHAIPAERVPFLRGVGVRDVLSRLTDEVDRLEDAHPAIELGLAWARRRAPGQSETVVLHGDLRVGIAQKPSERTDLAPQQRRSERDLALEDAESVYGDERAEPEPRIVDPREHFGLDELAHGLGKLRGIRAILHQPARSRR